MYWSPSTIVPRIANSMTINRFDEIKRFLHFNDNALLPNRESPHYDKLYKARPLLDYIRKVCLSLRNTEHQAIDEQMIPTKSRNPVRQYLPNKPSKWGIKVWARCGVNGLLFDFEIYTGKANAHHSAFGIGGDVVLKLCNTLPTSATNYKLYFDNYFSSIPLLIQLRQLNLWTVCTIRKNRTKGCDKFLEKETALKKRGRGSIDWRVEENSNVLVLRWMDSGVVQLASNYLNADLGEQCDRYNAEKKERVKVDCPKIVQVYNKHMGGVDLHDMLVSLYRVTLKTRKWYLHLFFYTLNVMVVNAWILHRDQEKRLKTSKKKRYTVLKFVTEVADCFLSVGKTVSQNKRKRSFTPVEDIRHDGIGHWPIYLSNQQKCRLCMDLRKEKVGRTMVKCSKCDVNLCLTHDRNCFYDYHIN